MKPGLIKSVRRKLDTLPDVRKRLARCLREQRMGFKAANVMLKAIARRPPENGNA